MAFTAANGRPARNWPQVKSGPLVLGASLVGAGALLAIAGFAVAGSHLVSATRQWSRELETPPGQLARLKWQQAKSAAAAGADHWRSHPNAKVGLNKRAAFSHR